MGHGQQSHYFTVYGDDHDRLALRLQRDQPLLYVTVPDGTLTQETTSTGKYLVPLYSRFQATTGNRHKVLRRGFEDQTSRPGALANSGSQRMFGSLFRLGNETQHVII